MHFKVCISRIVLHLTFSRLWRFILWPSELWHSVVWSVVTAFRMDTLLKWSGCNTLWSFDRFAPTSENTRCYNTEDRSVNLVVLLEFLLNTLTLDYQVGKIATTLAERSESATKTWPLRLCHRLWCGLFIYRWLI